MNRVPRLLLAFVLSMDAATVQPATRLMAFPAEPAGDPDPQASLRTAAANVPDTSFEDYDFQTEQQLLALANQSRQQAGAPPLTIDSRQQLTSSLNRREKTLRSTTMPSTGMNISCFPPRIAGIFSTRPITSSDWASFAAEIGYTLCRTSDLPSPNILPRK